MSEMVQRRNNDFGGDLDHRLDLGLLLLFNRMQNIRFVVVYALKM